MKQRFSVAVLALAAFFAIATSAGAASLYAPLYSAPGDKVSAWNAGADGSLTELSGSPFDIGQAPAAGLSGLAFSPDGTRAVATFSFSGGIRAITVNATGSLVPAQNVAGSLNGGAAAIAPNAKFVYQGVFGALKGVMAYTINASGQLAALPGSPYSSGTSFEDVLITPDGKFLYAVQSGAIRPFAIAADGSLTPGVPYAFSGVDTIRMAPSGKHLFATSFTDNTVAGFVIKADGNLEIAGPPVPAGSTSVGRYALSHDGSRLYLSDYNGDTLGSNIYAVLVYAVAADGSLSFMGGVPTASERPRDLALSPDGRYLYGADLSSGNVFAFTIGANGMPEAFRMVGSIPSTSTPLPWVFRPVQASTAAFAAKPGSSSLTYSFDGAQSLIPAGALPGYAWSFGDGATESAATPTTVHTFPRAGVYDVTLTASGDGCSTAFVYDGRSTICNGAPTAAKTVRIDTPPWITSLKVSPSKITSKTNIKFKLTEKASVSFYAQKPLPGRTVGTSCKKQTSKNKKAKKCTRWVRASKTFRKNGKAGRTNSVKFTGKVGKKQLAKGSYRLYAVATDSAKGKGPARTAKFRITK
ncbi:MAG: beta-propeller fold lactonase family protein [Thermoleophilaceae bacterium]|nr:beta-propeller fold lactonase family protein [Thermoleophilaceae bacterium]